MRPAPKLRGKTVAIWGLAFKPNTDDMREAPSLVLIEKLLFEGCTVSTFDPVAMEESQRIIGNTITYAEHQYEPLQDADALIIVTEWQAFRTPDFNRMKSLLKNNLIFDGRNIYDTEDMKEQGFIYYSIGRAIVNKV